MKSFGIFLLACLAITASADEWDNIDWSSVIPRTEVPGFWDGRIIKPAFYPGDQTRTGRIVGG
jgi:hypothetical protein